jgi:putative sterol carrier protein
MPDGFLEKTGMSQSAFSAKDFFEKKMNQKLKAHPESVEDLYCVYEFEIGDQIWNLDLTQSKKEIKAGAAEESDCRLSISESDFEKLLKKELNVGLALVTGKIKIKGEKALAMKLGKILS